MSNLSEIQKNLRGVFSLLKIKLDDIEKINSGLRRVMNSLKISEEVKKVQHIDHQIQIFRNRVMVPDPIAKISAVIADADASETKCFDDVLNLFNMIYVIIDFYEEHLEKMYGLTDGFNGTKMQMLQMNNDKLTKISPVFKDAADFFQRFMDGQCMVLSSKAMDKLLKKYFSKKELKSLKKKMSEDIGSLEGEEKDVSVKKSRFFATTSDDISKAPVDFFSIGHVLMGQIAFFVVYSLLTYVPEFYALVGEPIEIEFWAAVASIAFGLLWEPFENIILWKLGLKFESKRDSFLNILFDIVFVMGGAYLAMIINVWEINLILVTVEFVAFFAIRAIVMNK